MKFDLSYLSDLTVLHPGCEKPRAYFIPHETAASARKGDREKSGRFFSLCGEWDFRFCASARELGDFLSADAPAFSETIRVPMSWQMALERDYDKPLYTNRRYPYPIDPPHVPDKNPCGLYRRKFTVDCAMLENREVYLNFEGVDSCFYAFVNGTFAAYSQVSHCTSEICVTPYLREGENELYVLVFKWCDGSYLEDQDKIRLSGIFREVYLLSRDRVHLSDLYVRTATAEDFSTATVNVELELSGSAEVSYTLADPNGATVTEGKLDAAQNAKFSIALDKPMLWSDELPQLYELLLTVGGETIRQTVGVRRYEVRDGVILINGKKVKCKGVNRCETHPELGYTVPMEQLRQDLMILKAYNVNMIRTSHYPNDPRFYELCDLYGFYVCDEADIETHGMQFRDLKYPTHQLSWGTITDDPAWREAYVDRAVRVMERDKNFACVIFWSVGNECGVGSNFRAMADYFHERMPGCLVHSENLTRLENMIEKGVITKEEAHWENYGRFADINSRMYPSLDDVKKFYISETAEQRPFYLCEYCHAMGNGPGDLQAYWDLIYSDDRFFGGCVWEMIDHSVNIGTKDDPKFVYGGYFGYPLNDGNFCVDGLLFPDRTPYTGMLEYRQVLRPARIDAFDFATGVFTVRSLRHFTDLGDLDLKWTLESDGKPIADGRICKLGIAPQESAEFCIDPAIFRGLTGDCYLTFSYLQNADRPWADAGYEVGFEQFEAPAAEKKTAAEKRELSLRTETFDYLITDGCTSWRVDRLRGQIAAIRAGEKDLLASPISLNVWRAPTDNDAKILPKWRTELLPLADTRCDKCEIVEQSAQRIVIAASLTLAAPSRRPLLRAELRYVFTDEGAVEIEQNYHVLSLSERLGAAYVAHDYVDESCLPRLGLQFSMTDGSEQLSWFGPGPTCAYSDMGVAARMGRFDMTVTDHFEHYIYPQENLAHSRTRRFAVCGDDGVGLRVTPAGDTKQLSFNCSHFTPHMLDEAKYDFELVPLEETVVNVDLLQTAIGSASCGAPVPMSERVVPGEYKFTVRIEPVTGSGDPLAY